MTASLRRALLLLAVISIIAAPRTSSSQPSGKQYTAQTLVLIGALYVLEQYYVALSKSRGAAHEANLLVDACSDAFTCNARTPKLHWSTRFVRDLLVFDVASASSLKPDRVALWRQHFEDYRTCWNGLITAPKPSDASTSQQPPCDAITADFKSQVPNTGLDLIDLKDALVGNSLYQQVLDQNVGAYANIDSLRTSFLTRLGFDLANEITASAQTTSPAFSGVSVQNVQDLLTKCLQIQDVSSSFDCINQLITIQQTFSTLRAQREACNFATHMYMPTYSTIRSAVGRAGGIPTIRNAPPDTPPGFPMKYDAHFDPSNLDVPQIRADFGHAPGC